MMPERI